MPGRTLETWVLRRHRRWRMGIAVAVRLSYSANTERQSRCLLVTVQPTENCFHSIAFMAMLNLPVISTAWHNAVYLCGHIKKMTSVQNISINVAARCIWDSKDMFIERWKYVLDVYG